MFSQFHCTDFFYAFDGFDTLFLYRFGFGMQIFNHCFLTVVAAEVGLCTVLACVNAYFAENIIEMFNV